MTGKVILATAILLAPFFLLCAVTVLVEGLQRIGRSFDKASDKADAAIIRSLQRSLR